MENIKRYVMNNYWNVINKEFYTVIKVIDYLFSNI